MAVYEYAHIETACEWGVEFESVQSIHDAPLAVCPNCGGPVKKLISRTSINVPKSNTELRDLGFTKFVKRDDGIYENVTRRDGENKYMERGKPETIPDLRKTIND